jgi:hypothetical protein
MAGIAHPDRDSIENGSLMGCRLSWGSQGLHRRHLLARNLLRSSRVWTPFVRDMTVTRGEDAKF